MKWAGGLNALKPIALARVTKFFKLALAIRSLANTLGRHKMDAVLTSQASGSCSPFLVTRTNLLVYL